MAQIDLKKEPSGADILATLAVKMYYERRRKLDHAAIKKLQERLDKSADDNNMLFWSLAALETVSQRVGKAGDRVTSERLSVFIKAQRHRYPELEVEVLSLAQDQAE